MNITPEEFDKIMSEYSKEQFSTDTWVIPTTIWDFWCSLVITDFPFPVIIHISLI